MAQQAGIREGMAQASTEQAADGCGSAAAPYASIIVPVYNVAGYLDAALESACGQTLRDIEIICIDDGSTDGSAALLNVWAARDGRVRAIHQPNGGVSAARNAGLRVARGKVVMFLDADDLLDPQACQVVRDAFGREAPDIVTFGAQCFPEGVASVRLEECLSPRDAVYEGDLNGLLYEENSRPYMWRSAFSRSLLQGEGIAFPEGLPVGEDQVFYFRAYPRSRKTVLLSRKLYRYRVDRGGSAMAAAGADDQARLGDHVRAACLIADEWARNGWFQRFGWQTLGWLLEFVALDLCVQPPQVLVPLKRQFGASLRAALDGRAAGDIPLGRRTCKMLAFMMDDERIQAPGKLALCGFYVERRGLAACVKRALQGVRERG